MVNDDLFAAFEATDYAVTTPHGEVILRVGEPPCGPDAACDAVRGRVITVITAWNPRSEPQDDAINAAANLRLADELHRHQWSWWPAVGRQRIADGADNRTPWSEDSFAVLDVEAAAMRALGQAYGQYAVFVWDGAAGTVILCG